MGRPTDYNQDLIALFLERIVTSDRSVSRICLDEDMPSSTSVYKWLTLYPEFAEKYARAKEMQGDAIADGMFDIADDGSNDWMERLAFNGGNPAWEVNGEVLQRSKLRIDTRKWYLSKILPKKYGDKIQQEVTGKDGAPFVISITKAESEL